MKKTTQKLWGAAFSEEPEKELLQSRFLVGPPQTFGVRFARTDRALQQHPPENRRAFGPCLDHDPPCYPI